MNPESILEFDIYEVTNPLEKKFTTLWGKKPYTIPARGRLLLPRFLAEKLAYELAEQVVQRGGGGISATLNKTLMRAETAKLLRLTQSANPTPRDEDLLSKQISELNSSEEYSGVDSVDPSTLTIVEEEDVERNSSKDNLNPNADEESEEEFVDTTVEAEVDFADLQDEDSDVREVMRENLMSGTKAELLESAKKAGVEVDEKLTKGQIVDRILDHSLSE